MRIYSCQGVQPDASGNSEVPALDSSGSTATPIGTVVAPLSLRSAFNSSASRTAGSMSAASELSTVRRSSKVAMRGVLHPARRSDMLAFRSSSRNVVEGMSDRAQEG